MGLAGWLLMHQISASLCVDLDGASVFLCDGVSRLTLN